MILFLLAFVAGVLTVLAPCTIALLPVIVGGSLSGAPSLRRTLTVTGSLGVSVIAFTLLLKASTLCVNVPQSFWEIVSGVVIALLGVAMIFPSVWERIPLVNRLNRTSNRLIATGYGRHNLGGDILMGAALGPVFSSCSPTYFLILAAVLPASFAVGFLYLVAYAVGMCGTLLLIALAGQKLLERFGLAADPKGWIKRTVGVLFIVIGVLIATGLEQQVELSFSNAGFSGLTGVEQALLEKFMPPAAPASSVASTTALAAVSATSSDAARIALEAAQYPKAPEIADPSGFINTAGAPIMIGQFRGTKVVLVDFWTYSCINCIREIPYLKAWYSAYASSGLEIVSIHTPEFAFEKVPANVEQAVKNFGIRYPVVLDNSYGTWNAFGNEYWPRLYIINTDGYIVYDHAGEGDYSATEAAIRSALAERDRVLGATSTMAASSSPAGVVAVDAAAVGSPETYFGSNRNEYLADGIAGQAGPQTLAVSTNAIRPNALYLEGQWDFNPEYALAATGSAILYDYSAKNMYFVAASENPAGTKIKILVDGKAPGALAGADVAPDGTATITGDRLYDLIAGGAYGEHTITIQILGGGLEAYTFTFG